MESTGHARVAAGVARRTSWNHDGAARRSLLFARPATAYTVFVSNEKDNTVSIIDSEKLEVVRTVKVGQRPRGITLIKGPSLAFGLRQRRQRRSGFRRATMELVRTLPSGPGPGTVHPASGRQAALRRQ